MRTSGAWLVVAVLAGVSAVAWGADALDLRRDYLRALERLEEDRAGSLERVFEKGNAAASALRESAARRDGGTEWFPAHAFLRGFSNGFVEGALAMGPDPRFFRELAHQRGTAVDQEFFELFADTYFADGVTRRYTVPRSEDSVCHVFDSPDVGPLYRKWTRFWATYPRAYADAVDREIRALEDMVAVSTCACGGPESVEAGLERFLKSFPRSPVVPQVRARLERLRAGTSDFRFRCPTG
ncbi:hypothetical protein HPC49_43965 [Pyxidicoccus fallax]|uniref:Uncharacterized protein n=1 Tax=Pyxidicoccus fallax TaxID=394095 RepID=A0A848LGE7_9BACT|nr:hypothetical protein [Pyxidicoccus fallax]NMO16335.1 hypothetical protein [Pyxidicoccus fallax]NPC85143.1 hypothetical protein [Pyxidicoccus fallax]